MPSLEERVSALENKVKDIKKVDKPDKKPRPSSKYNTFVKDYIEKQKKDGSTKSHKDLFADAAKAWSSSKKE